MAQVTSPIILDSTGQQIHSDLQQIKNVLTTPSTAADISFDNTGTGMQADDVQDAITELKSNLTDFENRFVEITGTLATIAGFVFKDYPSGFTQANTRVISFEIEFGSSPDVSWRSGQGIATNNQIRTFVSLTPSQIGVYNSESTNYSKNYRIIIMKVS